MLFNTLRTQFCQPWIENLQWTSLQTQLGLSVLLCWLKPKKSFFWKRQEVYFSFWLVYVSACYNFPKNLEGFKLIRACQGCFRSFYVCLFWFSSCSLQVIKHKIQMSLKNLSKVHLTVQFSYLLLYVQIHLSSSLQIILLDYIFPFPSWKNKRHSLKELRVLKMVPKGFCKYSPPPLSREWFHENLERNDCARNKGDFSRSWKETNSVWLLLLIKELFDQIF